jgi:transcriptional regulator with XRE-family HTH domain
MTTLGEFLQQMRQQRGITLEQAAAQTKISLRMLKALELNDFSQIPSEVFVRGFVRSYARFLDLDDGEVIKRYQESVSQFYTQAPAVEASKDLPVQSPGKQTWAIKLMVGAVIVLMGIAIYGRLSGPPERPMQDAVFTPAVTHPEKKIANVVQPPSEPPARVLPDELTVNVLGFSKPPADDLKTGPPADEKDLTLLIEASERSWVMAHIDDQVVKEVLLQPGERVRWQAKTKFVLTLGNAGGVKLELDGKTLDPQGPSGKVVKQVTLTR